MKAEMHLVNNGSKVEIVSLESLTGIAPTSSTDTTSATGATTTSTSAQQTLGAVTGPQSIEMTSPAYSCASLTTETDMSDTEAVTPEMYGSGVFEPSIRLGGKSRSASLETPTESTGAKSGDALGIRTGQTTELN